MDKRIELVKVEKFTASIHVGLHVKNAGITHSIADAENICQKYCDETGFCVSVTPTKYVYTNGCEQGAIVGILNYPRFSQSPDELHERAIILATELMLGLDQMRVTIDLPDNTLMLTNPYITT